MEKERKILKIVHLLVNKKGLSDYEVVREYECGIMLEGHEVKSIRDKHFHMKSSFITIREGELFLQKFHISPYKNIPNNSVIDPERERKLFLHKKDLLNLSQKIKEKGYTLIPIEVYFKGNLIKMKIALGRGRKLYEKKEVLKQRDIEMDVKRSISERR